MVTHFKESDLPLTLLLLSVAFVVMCLPTSWCIQLHLVNTEICTRMGMKVFKTSNFSFFLSCFFTIVFLINSIHIIFIF